jgi:BirA family biotin operon repressor/biotin-[acetyl-CoA-carboxylase] ligase
MGSKYYTKQPDATFCLHNLMKFMEKPFKSKRIFKLNEVESTNSYALKLPPGVPEGSIVWTLNQTEGRGQGNNKWESEPGQNLTFSIILYPNLLQIENQFYISKIISLAVADFISLFTANVSIKWPNDIYVNNKKIAGILIENIIEGPVIKQSVAGIGININQKKFTNYVPNPLSLSLLTDRQYDLEEMLEMLCDLLEYRYILLKDNEFQTIDANYGDILYRLNQMAEYITDGEVFKGKIAKVEPDGTLIIQDENEKFRRFLHNQVGYVL